MRKRHKLSAGRHMQASLCSLPTMRVTQNTLTCNVSAQEPSTQGFIGTHCLAYIKIPDSRRNCLQSRHSEPLLSDQLPEWKPFPCPSSQMSTLEAGLPKHQQAGLSCQVVLHRYHICINSKYHVTL